MNQIEQKQAAKEFVERWQNEEGNEDRQSRSFWIEFAQDLMNIANPTHVLDFERKVAGRKIDVFYEDMGVLIEQKSRGVDLDKKSERSKKAGEETPYQQAKWYADNLPYSLRPRWIVVSNFDEFRIHDLDADDPEHDYTAITLEELPDQLHLFKFLTDASASRLVREKELSIKAAEIVGRLYKGLSAQYRNIDTDKDEQRSLNILIVRFVFLLYAEDAGLLQEHQAFLRYMQGIDASRFRNALYELFEVLDTPEDERDPYLNEDLAAFPYINGSLFAKENIVIPQFTDEIKETLLREASQKFDWKDISPTIFGAAFESTLNPETRREGGMHYTSIENIHKVIDPLFLDDLKAELAEIEGEKVEKTRKLKLRQFQSKLASIKILDPACGSGNFLTESYLSLRKLENRVLESLLGDQMGLGFTGEQSPIMVSIDQFYGIEINDFAVSVAKTALWIAEEQTMDITQEILAVPLAFLPLTSNNNVHEGNALRMDWDDVLPASKCGYIIGNPPFVGASNCTAQQKQEIVDLFGKIKLSNSLDYVAGWYYKACEYIQDTQIRCAFVSTNSITQGEQVYPIWHTLHERFGVRIDFAWTTFVWNSEASNKAHVHVVIVGFSDKDATAPSAAYPKPHLYSEDNAREVAEISPYLKEGSFIAASSRKRPISDVAPLSYGNKPTDDGAFIFTEDEKDAFLVICPIAEKYFRRYVGAKDYLNGISRWCLWLLDASIADIEGLPEVQKRIDNVRQFRLSSSAKDTRKRAESPNEFFRTPVHDVPYLAIPRTSSERRRYLPIGFFDASTIPSDATSVIANAGLYEFGVLSSLAHNAWMRTVAGRLKSDYRYSGDIVYNTFVWPTPTSEQKQMIEQLAQSILDIRNSYPNKSLADLYDPDKMPPDLLAAHKALDKAVEKAYGVDFDGDEEKIVAHLFKLYADAVNEEK